MKKKSILASLIAFAILCIATFSFANDGMNQAANSVRNVVGGAENALENAGSSVANGIKGTLNAAGEATQDAAEGVKNGVENAGNMVENTAQGTKNAVTSTTREVTNDGNYNATRTSTGIASTNTIWMWFILAVIALAIVGLVWYYAMQTKTNDYRS